MNKPAKIALLILTFLAAFTGTALAAEAATGADGSLLDLLRPVYQAFSGGHYAYAASLGIIVVVALIKRESQSAWLHTDVGGSLLTLVAAASTASAAALATPGAHLTLSLIESSLLVGVGAAGGYSMLKRLLAPLVLKLQARLPSWAQGSCRVVLWVFDDLVPAPAPVAARRGKK